MHKIEIRRLITHYQSRWAVLRHNQKNTNKVLLLDDSFVIKNLLPGDTLCYNCLGEVYNGIIDNLSLEPKKLYDNLVLVNNFEFKYKTPEELSSYISDLASKTLKPGGRVIFSFQHRFLIYNRVNTSTTSMVSDFISQFQGYELVKFVNLINHSHAGYGDYFFCFNKL